uniref:Cytokine receptor-like factor 2 n=2 Tax=Propithecus coquereli TaxID=379532 RepID=A0A2K6EU40_PROCO
MSHAQTTGFLQYQSVLTDAAIAVGWGSVDIDNQSNGIWTRNRLPLGEETGVHLSQSLVGVHREALQVQIIWFNFETVRVTWNVSEHSGTNLTFLYTFGQREESRPNAARYFQRGGLSVSTQEVTLCRVPFSVKPASPGDLAFLWRPEEVTVTCPDLPYDGLLYEVQHRSTFDTSWQSKQEDTCNVTIEGLDAQKCYCFRARVKTTEASYGPDTYPSDWSQVTCWHGGQPRDSCPDKPVNAKFPKFILICSLVTLLTLCLLLLSLWKLGRVRKLLIPSVPDPKSSFSGLFEQHRGNFQEWIKDTQNVAQLHKMGSGGERDCGPEDVLVVQLAKTPTTVDALTPRTGEGESSGGSPQLARRAPQGGDMVSVGGFTFVMNDSSYVTL